MCIRDRFKLVVVSYHLRDKVTVIVDDRHFSRMLVIQLLRSFCLQQEVDVYKRQNRNNVESKEYEFVYKLVSN